MQKFLKAVFFILVSVSVTAAFWVFKDLLFPFVTSKAFFFRIAVELALPLYFYFILSDSRLRPNLKNPLNISILAFAVINFASSFAGVNVTRSLWGNFERMGGAYYIAHLAALYFFVLCLGQMGGAYLRNFLKVLLGVGVVVSVNGISGYLGGPTLVMDPTLPTRISSTLGNPIYVGSFLIIPLYLSLFFAHQNQKFTFSTFIYYFLALLSLIGIYLSGTRGAAVGVLVASFLGALIYLFFTHNKTVKKYGFLVVGVFAALGILLFVFNSRLPQGSTIRRLSNLNDSNTYSRLLQWKVALVGFKDRPILGTGPENYYVVANQYYDAEIAKYDPSWFDKPHNYLLEILVTNGVVGLAAYVAALIFIVAAFYKGFRGELYGALEFSFLLTALMAYQIQNLFVFDTVPASLMFFAFAGFAAYIWFAAKPPGTVKVTVLGSVPTHGFAAAAGALCLLVVLYAEYATNIVPIRVAKNVNYGYAYSSVDVVKAATYFKSATTLPFNFDEVETASKFADAGAAAARNATEQNREASYQAFQASFLYLKQITEKFPDSPILWQRLAIAYLMQSTQVDGKVIINPLAKEAINKAIDLAPERNEAKISLAQMYSLEGNNQEAEKLLLEAEKNMPTDRNAKLQLINFYKITGRTEEAVKIQEDLLSQNYIFASYAEAKWLIDYYAQKKDFNKALALQKTMAEKETTNVQVFVDWAKLHALAGNIVEAKQLAENIIKFEPARQKEMQELIDSLPKTATSTK